jgi:hypothetical protein
VIFWRDISTLFVFMVCDMSQVIVLIGGENNRCSCDMLAVAVTWQTLTLTVTDIIIFESETYPCAYIVSDRSLRLWEKLIVGVWFVCQFSDFYIRDFINQSNFSFFRWFFSGNVTLAIEMLTVVQPICILWMYEVQ